MVVTLKNTMARLSELGLAEYESRAYISLLRENPATAYEIARSSGIPTSKIYEALNKLTEKGIVAVLDEGRKKRYTPIDPTELLGRYKASMNALFDWLSEDLAEIRSGHEVSYIWNISGYDYLIDKANRIISDAKKSIMLSVWKDDFPAVEKSLQGAAKRKLSLAIIHFGPVKSTLKQLFSHPIEDTLYHEKGGRMMAVVADSSEVLIGTIAVDNRVEGAWSTNRGFVAVAEDYIKHDIYIMKIVRRFDSQLVKKFGPKYSKLRDVFSDEEER